MCHTPWPNMLGQRSIQAGSKAGQPGRDKAEQARLENLRLAQEAKVESTKRATKAAQLAPLSLGLQPNDVLEGEGVLSSAGRP